MPCRGKPQEITIDIKEPKGKKGGSGSSTIKTITEKAAKAGQRALDNLKWQLASQEELIDLNARRQIDSLLSMELKKEQISREGFDNRL